MSWGHRRPKPVCVWIFTGRRLSVRLTFVEGRLSQYAPSPFDHYAGSTPGELTQKLRRRFDDDTILCQRT